jgi:hypothetical protein
LRAVTLAAAFVLAGTYLGLSCFAQPGSDPPRQPGTAVIKSDTGKLTWQFAASRAEGPAERVATQDAETREQIEAYRRTQDNDEKIRIAKALPDLVGKQFDARQEVRERELKQLEEQLHKLQELHQRRAKQREQIVEERVRQLLRDADGLGWGSDEEQPAISDPRSSGRGANGAGRP